VRAPLDVLLLPAQWAPFAVRGLGSERCRAPGCVTRRAAAPCALRQGRRASHGASARMHASAGSRERALDPRVGERQPNRMHCVGHSSLHPVHPRPPGRRDVHVGNRPRPLRYYSSRSGITARSAQWQPAATVACLPARDLSREVELPVSAGSCRTPRQRRTAMRHCLVALPRPVAPPHSLAGTDWRLPLPLAPAPTHDGVSDGPARIRSIPSMQHQLQTSR